MPTHVHPTDNRENRLIAVQRLHADILEAQTSPDNLGSHAIRALNLSERIAKDFAHEAAEWSVLYAKELGDPG